MEDLGFLSILGSYMAGTIGLWIASVFLKTGNADFKTAAIYNGVALLGGITLVGLVTYSDSSGFALFAILGFSGFAFWLLRRLYITSVISSVILLVVATGLQLCLQHLGGWRP